MVFGVTCSGSGKEGGASDNMAATNNNDPFPPAVTSGGNSGATTTPSTSGSASMMNYGAVGNSSTGSVTTGTSRNNNNYQKNNFVVGYHSSGGAADYDSVEINQNVSGKYNKNGAGYVNINIDDYELEDDKNERERKIKERGGARPKIIKGGTKVQNLLDYEDDNSQLSDQNDDDKLLLPKSPKKKSNSSSSRNFDPRYNSNKNKNQYSLITMETSEDLLLHPNNSQTITNQSTASDNSSTGIGNNKRHNRRRSSGSGGSSGSNCSAISSGSSTTSSSSSSVLLHHDEPTTTSENVYQRQPLLLHPNDYSTSSSGGKDKPGASNPGSASSGGGASSKKKQHHRSGSDGGYSKFSSKLLSGYHDGGPSHFLQSTAATAVSAVNGLVKIQMPGPHRDEPRFPKEKLKTLWSFLFMVFNASLTTTSLALTHEQVPTQDPPLPDLVLDSFPVQQWGLDVSEIIIIVVIYFTIVIAIFHKHRYIVFRRVFLILGLLYFYRSITMYVTVLPVANPNYYCSPKLNHTSALVTIKRSLQLLSGFGLSINGQHTFCGDYIFSGHTSVLVLGYLIVKEYTPRRWWLLHWLYALLALTGVIMVLLARGHYTVDCVIAYYITTRLWYMYHTMANNPNLKEAGPHNHLSRMWWFPVFVYFEGGVGGCVPRHYEWPLPWPRRWGAKNPQRTS